MRRDRGWRRRTLDGSRRDHAAASVRGVAAARHDVAAAAGRGDGRRTTDAARLTDAVVNGLPLAEAAEQLRRSTARTRLKAIQTKTGCHRQVDLVRLALSLPAVRQC